MIDVDHQVNSARREVGSRVFETGELRVVTISRTYRKATVDDVWDACTDPERIPRWFLPITGDLRLGGSYQLEGNAGGKIERCDPPRSFAATWEYGGEVSWIELRLAPDPADPTASTRFTLEHVARVDDERWAEFGPGAVGVGWDLGLLGLGMYLSSGEQVDRAAVEAWFTSDNGKRFMALSSQGWCDANIASGADRAEAQAAADRTAAAYTGTAAE
jgi:uncharacterized protein YndB with AHSA1/START domain